jgi:hypothetical protein
MRVNEGRKGKKDESLAADMQLYNVCPASARTAPGC